MFKSAAEEFGEWADRCRRWARRAQTKEQRMTLQNWERLFSEAELEAQQDGDIAYCANPQAPTKS
jgi:hypothetical protein